MKKPTESMKMAQNSLNISKTETDWMNNGEILDDSAYSLECYAPFIDVLLLPEQ